MKQEDIQLETNCHQSRTGEAFGGVMVGEARQLAVFNVYAGAALKIICAP